MYRRLVAGAAALVMVGSGSLLGTHAQIQAATGTANAAYTAPQATITDYQFPDGFGVQNTTVTDSELGATMFDNLIGIDSHMLPFADLATTVPSLKNGGAKVVGGNLVVTWHLKPGMKFADGTPITADQLIFGTKLSMTTEGAFPTTDDQVSRISAPDPNTIVVTYNGLYGDYQIGPPGEASGTEGPEFMNYVAEAKKYGVGDVSQYAKGDYVRADWLKFVLTKSKR